jgi:hypothetical protein
MSVPIESRIAAVLLWVVAFGWALLPTPWLMWWVVVRGRLPVLPLIGEPNGGPFYLNYSHAVFVVLLAAAFVLGLVQAWAGWLLWNGQRSGALLQFALLPIEAVSGMGSRFPFRRSSRWPASSSWCWPGHDWSKAAFGARRTATGAVPHHSSGRVMRALRTPGNPEDT